MMQYYTDLMSGNFSKERENKLENVAYLKQQIDLELDKTEFQNVFSGQGNYIR